MALSKPTLNDTSAALFQTSDQISPAQADESGATRTPSVLQDVANDDQGNGTTTPTVIVQAQSQENATQEKTEAQAVMNWSKMKDSYLVFVAQVTVSLITVWFSSNGNRPMQRNARSLRDFAAGSNTIGYISCFTGIFMCGYTSTSSRTGVASRILTIIGYAGAAFGFLALMGMLLLDKLKLWVTFVACSTCLPAIATAISRL